MTRISPNRSVRHPRALIGATAFAVAAVLTGASSFAMAEQKRGHGFPISIAEARAAFEARFEALDTDGDGTISRSEFLAAPAMTHHGAMRSHHGMRGAGMKHRQKGDGPRAARQREGSGAEAREAWQAKRADLDAALFERLDADGDGRLSQEEFGNRREARREMTREHMFDRLDRDGSGTLSRAELGAWLERLEAMDADGDGVVTREEARAHRQARRGAEG